MVLNVFCLDRFYYILTSFNPDMHTLYWMCETKYWAFIKKEIFGKKIMLVKIVWYK